MPELNRIVVIGGSTGAIEGLQTIIGTLPADFPAAILIVQHVPPGGPDLLAGILRRAGALPATTARDGELAVAGHVYVAPADHHLLIGPANRIRITRGPKENRVRPAIDPLFRSAAAEYGPRAIGVVLSGMLDDGIAGLWAIRQRGGIAVVQNPEQAAAPSMPLNALKYVEVSHCIGIERIGPLLIELMNRPVPAAPAENIPPHIETELRIAGEDDARASGVMAWGKPSAFACPECHGVLLQRLEGAHVRYRCHTGHAYTLESLLAEYLEKTEESLWNAVRALDETIMVFSRMAEQAEASGDSSATARIRAHAAAAEARSQALRKILLSRQTIGEAPRA